MTGIRLYLSWRDRFYNPRQSSIEGEEIMHFYSALFLANAATDQIWSGFVEWLIGAFCGGFVVFIIAITKRHYDLQEINQRICFSELRVQFCNLAKSGNCDIFVISHLYTDLAFIPTLSKLEQRRLQEAARLASRNQGLIDLSDDNLGSRISERLIKWALGVSNQINRGEQTECAFFLSCTDPGGSTITIHLEIIPLKSLRKILDANGKNCSQILVQGSSHRERFAAFRRMALIAFSDETKRTEQGNIRGLARFMFAPTFIIPSERISQIAQNSSL